MFTTAPTTATTMFTITLTNTNNQELIDLAAVALDSIGDQLLLSQGHCVNMFLDLYSATDDYSLK